ncbi:MAG: hypothetical protein R2941_19620 [Desulfobacterales bacterium]
MNDTVHAFQNENNLLYLGGKFGGAGAIGSNFIACRTSKGDLNGNETCDLTDAIIALQVLGAMNPATLRTDFTTSGADVNGDKKAGSAEVIYILRTVAGQ